MITQRWELPAVELSELSYSIRNNPKIAFWFSQNPIYAADAKYSGFLCGIRHFNLPAYANSLLTLSGRNKSKCVLHLKLQMTHPSRQVFPVVPDAPYEYYYSIIAAAQYLISPRGDRPETYRYFFSNIVDAKIDNFKA
jgi:hypothetical protein